MSTEAKSEPSKPAEVLDVEPVRPNLANNDKLSDTVVLDAGKQTERDEPIDAHDEKAQGSDQNAEIEAMTDEPAVDFQSIIRPLKLDDSKNSMNSARSITS